MQIIDPWAPIILKDNCPVQNWKDIKSKADSLLTCVTNNSELEIGNAVSTVAEQVAPYTWDELNYFREWLNPRLSEVIDRWQLSYPRYGIVGSWINRHYRTGKTLEHCHRGCDIIVVYYLNVPENSGRLRVRDPMEYHWNGSISHQRGRNDLTGGYPIDVKTGDVVIFPAWLNHSTEESRTDEPRYVMSTNFAGDRVGN